MPPRPPGTSSYHGSPPRRPGGHTLLPISYVLVQAAAWWQARPPDLGEGIVYDPVTDTHHVTQHMPHHLQLYLSAAVTLLLCLGVLTLWRRAAGDARPAVRRAGHIGVTIALGITAFGLVAGPASAVQAPSLYDQGVAGAWIEPGLNEFTPVTHVNGTTYAAITNNGTEGMWLGVSHDAGATWTTSKIHSDDAGGANWAIAAADGQVVVAWNVHTAGTKRVVAHTDDLGANWTWVNHTMPAGNVFKQHIYAESALSWYHGVVHMSPSAPHTLRTYIYKTTDAGASWTQHGATLTWSSSVSGSFGAQGNSVYVHSPDRAVSAVAFTTSGTANRVDTAAWDGASWSTNTEYSTCCSFNPGRSWITTDGSRVFALVGINGSPGGPNSEFRARDTFGVGSWDRTQAVTGQFTHDVDESGLWISSETSWVHVGERRDTTAIQYSYSEDAFASYTEHDLSEGNDDAWAGPSADGTPMFTVGARFYRSPSYYNPVAHDNSTTGGEWLNIDYTYENSQDPNWWTYNATGITGNWTTSTFSTLSTETPCSLHMPSEGLGNQAVTVDNRLIWACSEDIGDPTRNWTAYNIYYPNGTLQVHHVGLPNSAEFVEAYTFDRVTWQATGGDVAMWNGTDVYCTFTCRDYYDFLVGVNDLGIDLNGTAWIVWSDNDGVNAGSWEDLLEDTTDNPIWTNGAYTPEAIAVHGDVWVADGLSLYKLSLANGTLLASTSTPTLTSSQGNGLIYTKDGRYLLRHDGTRAWVHNATSGAVIGRTSSFGDFDEMDVDLLNNYLVALERGGGGEIRIYPLYQLTTNADGLGGSGEGSSPNPDLVDNPFDDVNQFEPEPETTEEEATFSLTDTSGLAVALGVSTDAAGWFAGIILVLAIGGGAWTLTRSVPMAAIAAFLGVGFAVPLGFFPIYVPVVLGAGFAAVIAARGGRG